MAALVSHEDRRNDRSLRLWGADGQRSLDSAHVVLLGVTATGCETVKNVVLPGLRRFTIVDDAKVTERALGSNFFLSESDDTLGQNAADVAARVLSELNPASSGAAVICEPAHFVSSGQAAALLQAPANAGGSVVFIATTRVPLAQMLALDALVRERSWATAEVIDAPTAHLLVTGATGQIGWLRAVPATDAAIVLDPNPTPEQLFFDSRVLRPFPALKAWLEHYNPEDAALSDHTLAHLPWPAIVFHAARIWRTRANAAADAVPLTFKEKNEVKEVIRELARAGKGGESYDEALNAVRFWHPGAMTAKLDAVLSHPRVVSPPALSATEVAAAEAGHVTDPALLQAAQWHALHALRSFRAANGGDAPAQVSVPDFNATTDMFREVRTIFHAQSDADAATLRESAIASLIAASAGVSRKAAEALVTIETARKVAQNAWYLAVVPMPSLREELGATGARQMVYPDGAAAAPSGDAFAWSAKLNEVGGSAETGAPTIRSLGWYVALRAAWVQGPSTTLSAADPHDVAAIAAEARALQETATKLLTTAPDAALTGQLDEWARYGDSEFGPIAAVTGAIASQECIKLLQAKRVPAPPLVLFDGNNGFCATFGTAV